MPSIASNEIEVNVDDLANCVVSTENGERIELGQLWTSSPAILVFLRHFACISCRAHASRVWQNKSVLEKAGAKLHFVGVGNANYIKKFKEDLGIEGASFYSDPSLVSFRIAGFKRGFLASHGPQSILNSIKLYSEGHRYGSTTEGAGDFWQLGGTLVISADSRVTYQFISVAQGDFPPEKDFE